MTTSAAADAPRSRDPRYDILFDQVAIGPLVARNRFFQVPHCNGMGYREPRGASCHAEDEGGGRLGRRLHGASGDTSTSDVTPFIELRLWDDRDIPTLAHIAEEIHEGGALAGIELCHNGISSPNLASREAPIAPSHLPCAVSTREPVQARAMSKRDIADLRGWHRKAVRRALAAGYDLVYVYCGHGTSLLEDFLSRRFNVRDDEYGGSLVNRMRLLKEVLSDTREECEGRVAVACRLAVDELVGDAGLTRSETEEVVGELDDLTDLWDSRPRQVGGGLAHLPLRRGGSRGAARAAA